MAEETETTEVEKDDSTEFGEKDFVVDDKGNVDKEATIEKGAVFERLGLITSNLNSKGSTSSTRRGIIRSEMLPEIQKAMQHVDKFIHLEVEKGFNA